MCITDFVIVQRECFHPYYNNPLSVYESELEKGEGTEDIKFLKSLNALCMHVDIMLSRQKPDHSLFLSHVHLAVLVKFSVAASIYIYIYNA